MNRNTFAKKLSGIKDLVALARSYQMGDVGQYVSLGLMSADEAIEFQKGWELVGRIYKVGEAAKEAVKRPKWRDKYPKEYLRILDRLEVLEPEHKLTDEIGEIISNLTAKPVNRYWNGDSFGGQLGVAETAVKAVEYFRSLPDPNLEEYLELKDSKERRSQRDGTIVKRVNHENYDAWTHAQNKARDAAVEKFAAENAAALDKKKQLDRLIETRRAAKLLEIGQAIAKVLSAALPEGGK
jgi:hypothetical protein